MTEEKERKSQVEQQKPPAKSEAAARPDELNKPDEWLKNAIERINSTESEELEAQPTMNKLEYQTTISRSEYQTTALPTDKIVTRSPAPRSPAISKNQADNSAASRLPFQFLYSLIGLILGIVSAVGGIMLLVRGFAGSTSWSASVLGLRGDQISDTVPGAILIAFGIFLIFITRIKKH
jgi:hypothetical protein